MNRTWAEDSRKPPEEHRHAAALLALGAGSQLTQVVLVREMLMVFHGNELSIGIVMAAWLLWVGLGSLAASRIATDARRLPRAVALTTVGLAVLMPPTILALRGVRAFFRLLPGESLSFVDALGVSLPVLAPVCMLWGAQFVFLARLWQQHPESGDIPGGIRAYAFEALGNLAGGLVFSLALVHVLDSFACLAVAALLMALAAAHLAAPRTFIRRVLVALALLLAASLPFQNRLDAWGHRLHWSRLAPDSPLVETYRSRYGLIAVVRRGDQFAFYQSGQFAFSTGADDATDPSFEEQEAAILAHLSLAQHPDPRRVLLIGGGLRGVLREMAAQPLEAIDYVELDPALIRAARARVPADTRAALDDPRVRVLAGDGRMAIKTMDRLYDLIVVDVPDPSTAALNRFYTREFFAEARARLRPGGILALGAVSTAGLRESSAANRNAAIYHTLRSEFARVLPIGDRFLLFFATDDPARLSADPVVLRERHRSRQAPSAAFSDALFFTLLQDAPLRRVNWILRHHGRQPGDAFAPPASGPMMLPSIEQQDELEAGLPPPAPRYFINSDFRPIAYYHTLVFWNRHARGRHGAALAVLLRVREWWIAPFLASILLAAAVLRWTAPRSAVGSRFGLGFAVWTTGFSTMATQIVLLFAFQSQYGFVYEMIGLIVAIFMGGLAAGALGYRGPRTVGALAAIQLLIAGWALVLAAGLPAAARIASAQWIFALFAAMTFLAGLWNGFNFPVAIACAREIDPRPGAGIGVLYGIELLGACLGALLAGVAVVPVLGLAACCVLAAALNAAAFAVLYLTRWTPGRAMESELTT